MKFVFSLICAFAFTTASASAPPQSFVFFAPPAPALPRVVICDRYDLYARLTALKTPFAETFTRVAILETGWHFEYALNHNIFGFKCNSLTANMAGCEYDHAAFHDREQAVTFLIEWIGYAPPYPAETAEAFLIRRGYNPYSDYIGKLQGVTLTNNLAHSCASPTKCAL